MKKQNILFWLSTAISTLLGILSIGAGIYLLARGNNCLSYNDYACSFGVIFSFIIILYGCAILLFVGLASLPFRITRLIGAIMSALTGLANVSLCCVVTMFPFSGSGAELLSSEMGSFLLFPLAIALGGLALLGVGFLGYLRAK